MKTVQFLYLIVVITALYACSQEKDARQSSGEAIVQTDDQEAVKVTIAAETAAYVNRDSTLLLSFYADDTVTQSVWNNPDGTFGSYKGFERIRNNFRRAFRNNPERQHLPEVERTDWSFKRLNDEWMWVNFTQKMMLTDGKLYTNYETRLMKREDNRWKIAVMYALSDHGKSIK